MLFLRQNATHKVVLGPFVDVGDGFTPETGITLGAADEAEAILHDNGTVVSISGYTWAAITTADGYYHLTLQSGITGTIGHMTVIVQDDSVCLPVKADFTVLEEAVYDQMFASSAAGALQPTTAGRTLDVTATGAAGIDWGNVENKTTANDLSATDIQLVDTTTTNTDMVGTDGAYTGTPPTAAAIADQVWDEALEDHDTQGNAGWPIMLAAYGGPRGLGVYFDDAAANSGTVNGTDGTAINPISAIASAKTVADALGVRRIYVVNDSAITLSASMADYEFVGIGSPDANSIALASQSLDGASFYNLTISGVQAGTTRAHFEDCIFGTATVHLFARRCGFTDAATGITFSNNDDNILEGCFSMVAGNTAPIFICSGANLDLSVRHYSGGLEIASSNATATLSIEAFGQVIFAATCSTSTPVTMRGLMTITDNTGGMAALTETARIDVTQINDQVVDVLRTDTVTELAAVPAANAALHDMVQWIYSMHRNKRTTTATTDTVRDDADGADIGASTISDAAGTFTRGEYS